MARSYCLLLALASEAAVGGGKGRAVDEEEADDMYARVGKGRSSWDEESLDIKMPTAGEGSLQEGIVDLCETRQRFLDGVAAGKFKRVNLTWFFYYDYYSNHGIDMRPFFPNCYIVGENQMHRFQKAPHLIEQFQEAYNNGWDCAPKPPIPMGYDGFVVVTAPFKPLDANAFRQMREWALAYPQSDWDLDERRRLKPRTPHRHTFAIELFTNAKNKFPSMKPVQPCPKRDPHGTDWARWKPLVEEVKRHSVEAFGDGKDLDVWRAILVKLPAGKDIYPHVDRSPAQMLPRRVHVPLTTAAEVKLAGKHYGVNEPFELNNMVRHAVENRSPTDRIHLIVDLYPNCGGSTMEVPKWKFEDVHLEQLRGSEL